VSILADFRRLAEFSGREPRRQFWPYVGIVYLADVIVGQFAMIPIVTRMMQNMLTVMMDPAFTAKLEANPFQAQGAMFTAMAGDMRWIAMASMASGAVLVVLLAAAVSRRLHDSGLSAWWGAMPLPFAVVHMALMPWFFSAFAAMFSGASQPNTTFLTLFMLNNTLSMAAMIALIVLLCRRSSDGDNRFSLAPA
jgi:uncharacterized membrane protein YhaH (DUF805 family)